MDTNAVNFNSMASATGALLQILTGESWHAVMYRAIDATNRVVMSFYFISLVALVILLFANIFIGTYPTYSAAAPPACHAHSQQSAGAAPVVGACRTPCPMMANTTCLGDTGEQVSWWTRSRSWMTLMRRATSLSGLERR